MRWHLSARYFKVLGRHVLRLAQIMTPPRYDGLEPKDFYSMIGLM